jgi:hypothetical protein
MPVRTVTVSRIKTGSRAPTERRLHSNPRVPLRNVGRFPAIPTRTARLGAVTNPLILKGAEPPLPLDASCGSVFASYLCRARWCRP